MITIDPSRYVVGPGRTIEDVDLDKEDVRLLDGRRPINGLEDKIVKDGVADRQPAADDDRRAEPAPALQRGLRRPAGDPVEIAAGLARPLTTQLHLTDGEMPTHQ